MTLINLFMWLTPINGTVENIAFEWMRSNSVSSLNMLLLKFINTRSHNRLLLVMVAFDPVGPLTFDSVSGRFISGPAEGNRS